MRDGGALRLVVGGTAMAVSAGACVGVLGIEPLAEDRCRVPAAASAECRSCLAESCCDEGRACAEAPDCAPWGSCVAACALDDPGCRYQCLRGVPGARESEARAAADDCRRRSCRDACVGLGGWADLARSPNDPGTAPLKRRIAARPSVVGACMHYPFPHGDGSIEASP